MWEPHAHNEGPSWNGFELRFSRFEAQGFYHCVIPFQHFQSCDSVLSEKVANFVLTQGDLNNTGSSLSYENQLQGDLNSTGNSLSEENQS